MIATDWYSKYKFVRPLGQCGSAAFFFAREVSSNAPVVIKQYFFTAAACKDQVSSFADDQRIFAKLHQAGLIKFFDSHSADKFLLVLDVEAACDWACSHLDKSEIMSRS